MAERSNLINETIMFSINKDTGKVVVHHLPWARTSPQLETYIEKGFTFERPVETKVIMAAIKELDGAPVPTKGRRLHDGERVIAAGCDYPGCQFVAKSEFGLSVHSRKHLRK